MQYNKQGHPRAREETEFKFDTGMFTGAPAGRTVSTPYHNTAASSRDAVATQNPFRDPFDSPYDMPNLNSSWGSWTSDVEKEDLVPSPVSSTACEHRLAPCESFNEPEAQTTSPDARLAGTLGGLSDVLLRPLVKLATVAVSKHATTNSASPATPKSLNPSSTINSTTRIPSRSASAGSGSSQNASNPKNSIRGAIHAITTCLGSTSTRGYGQLDDDEKPLVVAASSRADRRPEMSRPTQR